mmetsp:Transcript_29051/g.69412  ORF Transcript_29051/g.69412 Transcript_29051/m.69412 type:complete len:145 (+) Transcript_29051:329-763(+)
MFKEREAQQYAPPPALEQPPQVPQVVPPHPPAVDAPADMDAENTHPPENPDSAMPDPDETPDVEQPLPADKGKAPAVSQASVVLSQPSLGRTAPSSSTATHLMSARGKSPSPQPVYDAEHQETQSNPPSERLNLGGNDQRFRGM